MNQPQTDLRKINIDEFHLEKGVRFVTFEDRKLLNDNLIERVKDEILDCLNPESSNYHPTAHLCLDFGGVDSLSSNLLPYLVTANKRQRAKYNKRLGLIALKPEIRELFRMASLDKVFPIENTREDYLSKYCS